MQLSFGSIFGKVSTPKFRESNGDCTEICNGGSMACSFVGRNLPGHYEKFRLGKSSGLLLAEAVHQRILPHGLSELIMENLVIHKLWLEIKSQKNETLKFTLVGDG